MTTTSPTADREIVTTRLINAPRELVFEAWTKPEHLQHWWGPNGFTITNKEVNIVPGGKWIFTMHGPDGKNYANVVAFHEVTPPSTLRYSHSGPEHPEWLNFSTTVTFEEVSPGKTQCTMTAVFLSKEAVEFLIREVGAKEGGEETIGKLADYLEKLL